MKPYDLFVVLALTTLSILVMVVGVAIVSIRASQKNSRNQLLLAKAQISFEKELREVEAEVSETMMERFAQELHDNIGHHLTLIRLLAENLKLDNPALASAFLPVDDALDKATQQLRLLSRSLNTEYVSQIGLKTAIQIEVDRLVQSGRYEVTWQAAAALPLLSKNQELLLFRIFQEIIQNAIRHSKARKIFIYLSNAPDRILEIEDDGSGFDVGQMMQSSCASGLKNIYKRVKLAGMECAITSTPGNGCNYRIYSIMALPADSPHQKNN